VESGWNAVLQTLEGHSSPVSSVVFSHDSKLLASASDNRTVKIWDASTGSYQQTLEGHSNWVSSVAFSHDSKLLASASYDHTVKIWDASTGSYQQTLEGHSGPVSSVAFSHDSKLLASASDDHTVKIWDASTGSYQQTLEGHSNWVSSVAFSHDSKLLASASYDRTVKIWDASTGSCQQTVTVNTYVSSLLFDDIESHLLTNVGSIKVDRARVFTRSEHPLEGRDKGDRQGLGIRESWVTWNAQNLLWLPPYSRGGYTISPSRSIIASGCGSGKVYIIRFLLANLM
jgi:WD40 repeat protein